MLFQKFLVSTLVAAGPLRLVIGSPVDRNASSVTVSVPTSTGFHSHSHWSKSTAHHSKPTSHHSKPTGESTSKAKPTTTHHTKPTSESASKVKPTTSV
ncbi:hypothetical protein OIDMADRAFT_60893 [Oidiodendron maius Zn]|uniref:Secreted protein n=1 Tax=Oidiodendron maius (strain Zn) TaxID=913774 RepID=A0A0C3GD21_OIDMZ|nr:hypothetical protein OIDMADRAFT_60893 [Oidiodendron maius Zn]